MTSGRVGVPRPAGALLVALVAMYGATPAPLRGAAQSPQFPYTDITERSGVTFVHTNGADGELLLPEVIGAGGALVDYDGDGDLDLFAVQGSSLRSQQPATAPRSRLYRNDLGTGGSREVRFTDVTDRAALSVAGYGMGAAVGDFDNDGRVDLYVTTLGRNRMLRNNGDGTFADVTQSTGTGDGRWSTSATFFDYDRDGWLDLFVAHYVDFDVNMKRGCFAADSSRDYCNPAVYAPVADRLYHNNRDGTFSDVSAGAGFLRAPARGLGVLAADFNGDGWTDLYVANDGDPNQLWINGGGRGTFTDEALLAGVALSRAGRAQGSMGVDLGDIDGDGDEDLFVTNLDNEANTLYRNVGKGLFEDRTVETGLFKLGLTGFGARFVDYNNDGWLDLVVANGAVRRLRQQAQHGDAFPLRQRSLLFRNDRGRRFVDVSGSAGPAFAGTHVARGVASGDLDNDGDTDLVIFESGGPLRVLLNAAGQTQHWLGIRVLDGRRDALQARVELVERGRVLVRRIQVDGSYCSANDPRTIFGLGADRTPKTVRVYWPGGRVEEFSGLTADRYWSLEAGKGRRQDRP